MLANTAMNSAPTTTSNVVNMAFLPDGCGSCGPTLRENARVAADGYEGFTARSVMASAASDGDLPKGAASTRPACKEAAV